MRVCVSLRVTLALRKRARDGMMGGHSKCRQKVFVNVWCGPFKKMRYYNNEMIERVEMKREQGRGDFGWVVLDTRLYARRDLVWCRV